MKNNAFLWALAALLTLSLAIYQRMTGPTYALKGKTVLQLPAGEQTVRYKFDRSHSGNDNHSVQLKVPDNSWQGTLEWKRFKTSDAWTAVAMTFANGELQGFLPGQPPAGKLQYRIKLEALQTGATISAVLPDEKGIVIRFKGKVPPFILVPHVIAMFAAMLLATRTGIQALVKPTELKKLAYWTVGLFSFGGMFLGPVVQLYAFGALWTGWPYGTDLTDNKTLIAWIVWLLALAMLHLARKPARWVLAAVFVMWGVYLIPHSMFGSELDYNKLDQQKVMTTSG
ncbi:MAG TPA: hypothetical protein DCS07_17390 [Bdellovibrionales bacterium]|nr:hypothetical protein [Bdellovibrionales bacterium]HCM38522.1 hypothetical protein [Bdellovibrionales bacterium]